MGKSKINDQMTITPFPSRIVRIMSRRISCARFPILDDEDEHSGRKFVEKTIKLIKSDGGIRIYHRPIKGWELMEEFPKHMVCRSDSFYIGQITPALSHHDWLQVGQSYFLLPAVFFQSALSFSGFLRCRSNFGGNSPFEVEKTPTGSLRIKVSEEVIVRHHERQSEMARRFVRVCDTPQLLKEYDQMVVKRHQWKPKLDTIAEKKKKKLRRRKKKSVVL